jgi:hypothetical protein
MRFGSTSSASSVAHLKPMNDAFGRANSNSARNANAPVASPNQYLVRRP